MTKEDDMALGSYLPFIGMGLANGISPYPGHAYRSIPDKSMYSDQHKKPKSVVSRRKNNKTANNSRKKNRRK
jgi:hypothetical protein